MKTRAQSNGEDPPVPRRSPRKHALAPAPDAQPKKKKARRSRPRAKNGDDELPALIDRRLIDPDWADDDDDDDDDDRTELDRCHALINSLQGTVKTLEARIATPLANIAPKITTRKGAAPPNKDIMAMIAKWWKEENWRLCKFMWKDVHEEEACRHFIRACMDDASLIIQGSKGENDFIGTYAHYMTKVLNNTRSYVQGRLKEKLFKFVDENGRWPTLAELRACVTREFDPNKPEMMAIFVWYWNELLPVAAFYMEHWGVSIRCNNTISQAHFPGKPNKKYITQAHEAMCYVLMANNMRPEANQEGKWELMYRLKGLHKGKKFINRAITPPGAAFKDPLTNERVNYHVGDKFITLYEDQGHGGRFTDTTSGQNRFGGWKPEGRRLFRTIRDANKLAREKDTTKAIELAALVKVKQINSTASQLAAALPQQQPPPDDESKTELYGDEE